MSSRYVDRVTTISDFIYLTYLKNWTITFFNLRLHLHPLALIESPIPHLQSQVLSRIYPTNIITGIRVFFLLMGHQGHTFPNCLSRHATIYHYAVFPFVLLFSYSHKNIARKRASSEYFCVRIVRPVLHAVNSLTRHNLNRHLKRVGFRYDAIVLVLGTLSDERRRLRHEP